VHFEALPSSQLIPPRHRTAREAAAHNTRPSKPKRKTSDNSRNDNPRRKKVKSKSAVPPCTSVIDLANDVPISSVASHGITSSALPSTAATLQNAPIASQLLCLTQKETSTSAISSVATAQVSSPTHPFEAPSTSTNMPMPVHSNIPAQPPNSSNLLLSLSPPTPSEETPPSQAVACKNTTTANLVVSEAPVIGLGLGEQGEQVEPLQVRLFVTNRSLIFH